MSEFMPHYQVGDALYFRYVPFDYIDTRTSEAITQTPEIPCTVVAIAHNLDHDIEIGPETWLPRVYTIGWTGFHYYVEIDLEEAAILGLDLRYPKPKDATYEAVPLNYEAIRENQITGERIAF